MPARDFKAKNAYETEFVTETCSLDLVVIIYDPLFFCSRNFIVFIQMNLI